MITSLDHIHIHAADPLATIRFYESCLGAEHLGSIPSGEGGKNHGVLLGGQLLVISEFPPGMTPSEPPEIGDGALRSGFGVAHFGVQTNDLDGALDRLRIAGAHVHSEARRTGSIRYAYATVPDGVVIELVELHLPARLAKLMPLLNGVNRTIHLTRKALAKQLFKP
ncbi:MAG: VOC family protein [Polyangiales bacterium]